MPVQKQYLTRAVFLIKNVIKTDVLYKKYISRFSKLRAVR